MRKKLLFRPMAAMLIAAMFHTGIIFPGSAAWAVTATAPLSQVTNPVFGTLGGTVPTTVPAQLAPFVKDINAAIKLGKALFWDMQVGSDGVTACASCHYRAGADPLNFRPRNQLNPGANGTFDLKAGADIALTPSDFPFFRGAALLNPPFAATPFDDVFGSQGVTNRQFLSVTTGSRKDDGSVIPDTIFQAGGANVRQVTGRNTPPAINAVFNFANFWDGRAHNSFNGNNPLGPLDPSQALPSTNSFTGIWRNIGDAVDPIIQNEKVSIPNASLASQAVGPPLSPVEMSWGGRTFPQLGKKMLSLTPLAIQHVSPTDSVLGSLSRAPAAKGLNTTYPKMIQDAFVNNLWNANLTTPDGFTQMEANFSLFWGIAVMCYEATLVSDQTPFDQFLGGNATAMSAAAQNGFQRFDGKCGACHSDNEMTTASVRNTTGNLITNGAANTPGLTDTGFNNIGVRPTADDLGRGASINFPLSFSEQALAGLFGVANPAPGVLVSQVRGGFKVPSLRNIALTPPYMHDGSIATLEGVLDFYERGGNFANPEQDQDMAGAGVGGGGNRADVLAFLQALTDPRVANESAPFDHPELLIPNGGPDRANGDPAGAMIRLAARGAGGSPEPALPAVVLDPALPATTNRATMTISGTNEAGAQVQVVVNNGSPLPVDTQNDTTFSTTVTGLAVGANTITVTAIPLDGVATTKTASLTLAFPSGILSGGSLISVSDALKVLRFAVGLGTPTAADIANGDVAPLVGGLPEPDGKITVADALVILRKVVGLEHF